MTGPPVLRDVPSTLHTPRLLMRCPQPGDGALVHAAVVDTLAPLRQFPASLPWAMAASSVAASEQFCSAAQADLLLRWNLPMALFLHGSNKCIGSRGLHGLDWTVPKDEAGCARAGSALERVLRHERAAPDGRLRHTRGYAITG